MPSLLTEADQLEAVSNFRKYLKIPSVHPNIDYDECVSFLTKLADTVGLTVQIFNPVPKYPIVVMTYEGTNPEQPSLLLNSHMDVVPVNTKCWKHDPFAAEMDDEGNIYARGAQDMKSIGIQFVEAVRQCVKNRRKFKRTIHISFVPEEEVGGVNGMKEFVKSQDFKKLNVGCAIDESMPSNTDEFMVSYVDRLSWTLEIICTGPTGHGSLLLNNTAGEKLRYVIDKFMDYRESEKQKLNANPNLTLGDVTTVNLMIIKGGVKSNVLPSSLSAIFALRVAVDVDYDKLNNTILEWCKEAGEGVFYKEIQKNDIPSKTKLDDTNPWWLTFKNSCDKMELKIKTVVFPGGTDSRSLRKLGIPAFGFSAINHTEILLHDNDEYLNRQIFLNGIEIYYNIIGELANV